MNNISKYIIFSILFLGLFIFSSCHSDSPELIEKPSEMNSHFIVPHVTIKISPISLSPVNEGVIEKIRTLRIIMVSEQKKEDNSTISYIEFNRFIDFQNSPTFQGPGEYASYFRYVFTTPTVPGVKKFYLIANESSVGKVKFQIDDEIFPQGLPSDVENEMNLTDFLNLFTPNYIPDYENIPDLTNGVGEPRGKDFENLINCLYYTPEFITEDNGTSIFLPYSAFYKHEVAAYGEDSEGLQYVINESMYLVPAANKFIFKFKNYRPENLVITSFKLSGMASDMYLFGQVNNDDQQKTLNGIKLWWIDWMAGVSRLSYPENSSGYPEGPDNEVFNQTYGWIDKFNIPATAFDPEFDEEINLERRKGVTEFIPKGTNWWVESRDMSAPINTAQPGTAITGYYYLPESRYTVPQNILDENQNIIGTTQVQRYFLTMTMHDDATGALTVTKDTPIGNLGSMFRGNNTLITVTLRDANDVGAYAQPERWKESHSFGNVIEEETP